MASGAAFGICTGPARASARGFSLVELMVAIVVALVAVLAITSAFRMFEGQKRTTTGSGDAQQNGLIAMSTIERDVRIGGLGLMGLGCTTINAYNVNKSPAAYTIEPMPVSITRDNPTTGTDRVAVVFSASPFGTIATPITVAMANSDAALSVTTGDAIAAGDLLLVSETGKACSLIQASAASVNGGGVWTVAHLPSAAHPFNPPLGTNTFPAGGYSTATPARITNMGASSAMANREYYVQNGQLMMRDLNLPDSAVAPLNPIALVDGVITIRAQYGRDTNGDGFVDVFDNTAPTNAAQIVAVRLAIATRSGQLEKTAVSPATLPLWNGGTVANGGAITLDAAAQRYRYKVYQTTIPLRNVIWTN